jgi:hypothetical protein
LKTFLRGAGKGRQKLAEIAGGAFGCVPPARKQIERQGHARQEVLKKHCVHEPLDTRFRSAARLLQALWREDRDLPIGSYVGEDGKRRKLGSRISESAGRGGSNFFTPEIAHTARREAAYREIGALIDAKRLAKNVGRDERQLVRAFRIPGPCFALQWTRSKFR